MPQNGYQSVPPVPSVGFPSGPTSGGSGSTADQTAFLAPVPAVMVRQRLQVLENFIPMWERKNFYRIGVTTPDQVKNPPDGDAFRAMNPTFVAEEDSECICRACCSNFREFKMLLSQAVGPDAPGQPLMRLERPFKCTLVCCGCIACPQEITVTSNDGTLLGTVVQDWDCGRCTELFCFPGGYSYYAVKGPAGDSQFFIRHKMPCFCNGCVNCCAPTCCNPVFEVDILDADGRTVLSQLKNVFPGFNCRCVTDASNLVMEFPAKATPEQKALLLGGLFLVEYIHFEQNKNDQ